ncbi:MAG: phosphomannose isomerase type II C-terminal cupin domain [Alphaproteobacteria bacterium]
MSVHYKTGDMDIRPWGIWEVIDVGATYIVKKITVMPGKILSLQLHHHRSEHWIIVSGTAEVTLDGRTFIAECNTPVYIEKEQKHRIANNTNLPMIFIEIQTGDILDENDIVRFEDRYGRV